MLVSVIPTLDNSKKLDVFLQLQVNKLYSRTFTKYCLDTFFCNSNKVLPKLESLPDGSSSAYYSMLIRCLIKWRWPQQILDLIYNWLLPATQQDKGNKENEVQSACDI